nr:hypothetical protein CFP56_54999 [Quercus suber]
MDSRRPSQRAYDTYASQRSPEQYQQSALGQQQEHDDESAGFSREHLLLHNSPVQSSVSSHQTSADRHNTYPFTATQHGATPVTGPGPVQYATYGMQMQASPQSLQHLRQYQTVGADAAHSVSQPTAQHIVKSAHDQEVQYESRLSGTFTGGSPGQYAASQHNPSSYGSQIAPTFGYPMQLLPYEYHQDRYMATQSLTQQGDSDGTARMGYAGPPTAQAHLEPYSAQPSSQYVDPIYHDYQVRIGNIFTLVRDGTLHNISEHLLAVTHYLMNNVEALGLTRDTEELHDERIRFWDEFNNAWLTTLQRQFDLTEEYLRTNLPLTEPQSVMTKETLDHLGQEIVNMCEALEKHGLVDYQMGVAEEQIIDRQSFTQSSRAYTSADTTLQ